MFAKDFQLICPKLQQQRLSFSMYSNMSQQGNNKGESITVPLTSCLTGLESAVMTSDNFCFYLQNRLIQSSQTGGQQHCDNSPFSFSWLQISIFICHQWRDQISQFFPIIFSLIQHLWVVQEGRRFIFRLIFYLVVKGAP